MERKKKNRISKEEQEEILSGFGIKMLPEDHMFSEKEKKGDDEEDADL